MFGISRISKELTYLKGVGPVMAKSFGERLGILTIADLLFYLPFRYDRISAVNDISSLKGNKIEEVVAKVKSSKIIFARRKIFEVIFEDKSSTIRALWFQFNRKYIENRFPEQSIWKIRGKVAIKPDGSKQYIHPVTSRLDDIDFDRVYNKENDEIIPIYPLTEKINNNLIIKLIERAFEYIDDIYDYLPEDINSKYRLPTLKESLIKLHKPSSDDDIFRFNEQQSVYHKKLIFNEFYISQIALRIKRMTANISCKILPLKIDSDLIKKAGNIFDFSLTKGQIKALNDIVADLKSGNRMNRLIQADVGAGKTAVIMMAAYIVISNKKQVALMAPTEILAKQHYENIYKLFSKYHIGVELLTSSSKKKNIILDKLKSGDIDIIIGTHAIIQDKISFKDLSLAVIDEQQRFGVLQRAKLASMGKNVHTLITTATPIPRTLAMTAYGDLDITQIKDMPKNRLRIITMIFENHNKSKGFDIIKNEISKGNRVYIICPLIEENNMLNLKAAESVYHSYKDGPLSGIDIGLLHGRMKPDEKDNVMKLFAEGKISALVSTTVVEVGMNIPEATVIMIENPERFGLAQLHQLRGRVGRSDRQSYALLMLSENPEPTALRKVDAMKKYSDGFNIAEEDLIIRGSGDILGSKQSGIPQFMLADIIRDRKALFFAREEAYKNIEDDPDLMKEKNRILKEAIKTIYNKKLSLADIG